MANCRNCPGTTCGCLVTGGTGASVTGTGTAANPFVVSIDPSTLNLGQTFAVTRTGTVELSKVGTGSVGDPVIITGDVVLRSPDNTRWTLQVSNTGALSTVLAGAPRSGTGSDSSGQTVLIGSDILYFDGLAWPVRSTAQHVLWMSLGYTGVPVPPGYKANDTWVCEAT